MRFLFMGHSNAAAPLSPDRVSARTTVQRTLVDEGVAIDAAERWCAAWEAEAERQGVRRSSPYFWDAGRGWIDAQRTFVKPAR